MTVLTSAQVTPMLVRGDGDLVGLYALKNVTTGDTVDMTTIATALPGSPAFQIIKRGVVISTTDFVEIAATFTDTVVTMPGGLNKSGGYLLLWGC
jgi:hypothetical protein